MRLVVATFLVLLPAPASAQCVLQAGVFETPLTARVDITPPLVVAVKNVAVEATLVDATRASFAVRAALRFVASGDAGQLALATSRGVDFADDVHASFGVPVRVERVVGGDAFMTLADAAWLGTLAERRRIACADVGPRHSAPPSEAERGSSWLSERDLRLHDTPQGRLAFTFAAADGFALDRLTEEGAWTRISISHPSGEGRVSISGWVTDGPRETSGGFFGRNTLHHRMPPEPDLSSVPYVTHARIAGDVSVYAAPEGEPWATTMEEGVWQVRVEPGATWAQILYVPGVYEASPHFEHAWVRRSDVHVEPPRFTPRLPSL